MNFVTTVVFEFLKSLEIAIPPPENCHHVICFSRYGSDKAGWQEKLALQVNKGGVFHCFFLSGDKGDDFSRESIDFIVKELAKSTPSNIQLGVAGGQFLK